MKKKAGDNQHKEDRIISEILQKNLVIQNAPEGFTNRFMQSILPVQELNPKLKKPLLDFKGKATAIVVFVLLFLAGMSIGHELTGYAGLTAFNSQLSSIFKLDYTIMMTIILFSFSILLIFNEILKKYFAKR